MELCNDCKENCCDDCFEHDCVCNLRNHTIAPCVLVRDALVALNPDHAYINCGEIIPELSIQGLPKTSMEILVNGNIFRVTLETIRCEQPDDSQD